MNKALLLGYLGADPTLRVTQQGLAILHFNMATTEVYFDKHQQKQERTEWHRVTVFGKRAEALSKILSKGRQVFVDGRFHTSSYEKNGDKRYSTEVIANDVIIAGNRPESETPTIEQIPFSNGVPTAAAEVDIPF